MVTNVLKICATGSVTNFLARYEIWHDFQVFYNNKADTKRVVNDASGIPCFHYTEVAKINCCNSKLVAIDNLTESIHSKKYFEKYKEDKHYLIFSGGYWPNDMLDVKYSYDLIWHEFFLMEMADTFNSPNRFPYYIEKSYQFDFPKTYNWVSTIGNVRPLRTKLVEKLSTLNLDRSILRYSGQDIGVKNHSLDIVQFAPGDFDPYTSILEKYYHNVSQTLPMSLYNSSYFNIVVETDLDLPGTIFLTEKTVKSLIVGQPFVVLANPGLLKHLHNLGFRTYSQLWNEDYDNELDFDSRLDMITNLVTELESFDWQKNKSQLEYIALHNRSNFMQLTNRINTEFFQFEHTVKNLVD